MDPLQTIAAGTIANDGTGDSLRVAAQKANANFGVIALNDTQGTTTLTGTKIWDGDLTKSVEFNDIATMTLDATSLNLSGVGNVSLASTGAGVGQGEVEIRADQDLLILTPETLAGTSYNGEVLSLVNATNGEVEFRRQAFTAVDSIAALKAIAVAQVPDGSLIQTRGYYTAGDGGHALYRYSSASSSSDNSGTIIAPTVGAGRYLMQIGTALNVRQFGAKGDSSTDDTAAIQAAFTASVSGGGGDVVFPKGIYKTTSQLNFDSSAQTLQMYRILGEGGAMISPKGSGCAVRFRMGRSEVNGLGVMLDDSTGAISTTVGFLFDDGSRNKCARPIVYAHGAAIPSSFVCIKVGGGVNWTRIETPHFRKIAGSVTGTFLAGVRIENVANATSVVSGSISNCDVGVLIDDSSTCVVDAVAFEDCGTGVKFTNDNGGTPNSVGGVVAFCRGEALSVSGITIDHLVPSPVLPYDYTFIGNIFSGLGTGIVNTNGVPITVIDQGQLTLATQNASKPTKLDVIGTAAVNALVAAVRPRSNALRPKGGFWSDANGIQYFSQCTNATAPRPSSYEASITDAFIINHQTNITQLISDREGGTSVIDFYACTGAGVRTQALRISATQITSYVEHLINGSIYIGTAGSKTTTVRHGTASLTAGSVTVSDANILSTSRIFVTGSVDGGTPGWLRVSARSVGVSFTITSSSATDTSTVSYMIINP